MSFLGIQLQWSVGLWKPILVALVIIGFMIGWSYMKGGGEE